MLSQRANMTSGRMALLVMELLMMEPPFKRLLTQPELLGVEQFSSPMGDYNITASSTPLQVHDSIVLEGEGYKSNIVASEDLEHDAFRITSPNVDSFVERPVRDGPWSARVSGREAPRAVGC